MVPVVLVIGAYNETEAPRRQEYEYCLTSNLKVFEAVHVLREDAHTWADTLAGTAKLHLAEHGHRATFAEYFQYANSNLAGCFVFVSNADIVVSTPAAVRTLPMDHTLLLLSKRQAEAEEIVSTRGLSLDTFAFKAPIRPFPADWYLGRPGCEHRLAYEARRAGMTCRNPARIIICRHYHASGIRHYNAKRHDHWVHGPKVSVPVT